MFRTLPKRHSLGARPLARKQRGQALIWLMGAMAAAVAVLYGVYDVTQITSGKQKAVNAADAAALAGANVEARLLNLMAYNNRAMVANEVFLVQMTSIDAWLGYFSNTAKRIGGVLKYIPYLNEFGVLIEEMGEYAGEARDNVISPFIDKALITVFEVEKKALGVAHFAFRNTGFLVAQDAAMKTAGANRSNFNEHMDAGVSIDTRAPVLAVTLTRNAGQWRNFTQQYSDRDRGEAAQVVQDARDQFSTDRPGSVFLDPPPIIPFMGFDKLGGTRLRDFDHWESEDTYEQWDGVGKFKVYIPLGYGRTNVTTDGDSGRKWAPGHEAQREAQSDGRDHTHSGWTGIPAVYDLSNRKPDERASVGVQFTVVVNREQSANLTTQKLHMQPTDHDVGPLGSPNMPERLQSDRLSAFGNARTTFERPQAGIGDRTAAALLRYDSAKEYGSLFSPYWEARLSPLDRVARLELYGAMGINPALSELTP